MLSMLDNNLLFFMVEPYFDNIKDIQFHFQLLNFVRKSILYAKITLSPKKLVSKLSCKQTACLLFS